MPKLSPELAERYEIAPGVTRTAFIHPILGHVDLSKAGLRLSAKLLKYGYIVELKQAPAPEPTPEKKPGRKRKSE